LKKPKKSFDRFNIRTLGVVLNRAAEKRKGYGYEYGYSYYSYRYKEKEPESETSG